MHPSFESTLGSQIGIRTKRSAERVAQSLVENHEVAPDIAQGLAEGALSQLLADVNEQGRTSVLYYASPDELADMARRLHSAVQENEDVAGRAQVAAQARQAVAEAGKDATKGQKKAAADALSDLKKDLKSVISDFVTAHEGQAQSVDVALFGRFLAEQPRLNLEASCQVAHAISTNRVSMDFDYYTAVDDLNPDEETGAGMIGTTGFNSSCFYRYAMIDVDQLAATLAGNGTSPEAGFELAQDGIRAFLNAAVAAIPTGKQNSFAAQTRPLLVLTVVRGDNSAPMSLVNAFEAPARPYRRNGTHVSLVQDSVQRLDAHWKELQALYGSEGAEHFLAYAKSAGPVEHLSEYDVGSIPALVDKTIGALAGGAR